MLLPQVLDAAWRIRVDGRRQTPVRAEYALMAVPVGPGPHTIAMRYRPLARTLYWPASGMLLVTSMVLAGVARRPPPTRT